MTENFGIDCVVPENGNLVTFESNHSILTKVNNFTFNIYMYILYIQYYILYILHIIYIDI